MIKILALRARTPRTILREGRAAKAALPKAFAIFETSRNSKIPFGEQ